MRTATKLKLMTLEDMEENQSQQQTPQFRHHHQETSPAQVAEVPRLLFHVAQIKYCREVSLPGWKRFVHQNIYLPLFRFCQKKLGFITPTLELPDGSLGWLEHQAYFCNEADAAAEAKRYPFGYVVKVPLGSSMTTDTIVDGSTVRFPNSDETLTVAPIPILVPLREEVDRLSATVQSARMI